MGATRIGEVPVWQLDDGSTVIDDDDVGNLVGGPISLGKRPGKRPLANVRVQPAPAPRRLSPEMAYQSAIAGGLVSENATLGLGYQSLSGTAGATVSCSATVQRNIWCKSFIASAVYSTSYVSGLYSACGVTALTIAGIPINIGTGAVPITALQGDATRFGMSFGRRFAGVGTLIQVDFVNFLGVPANVSAGVIGDEMNPFVQGQLAQMQLLQAAGSGFPGIG